jgi:hypothetical protein
MRRASAAAAAMLACAAAHAAEHAPRQRHEAPIVIEQRAPFVVLPLDREAYRHSTAPDLADLLVVDARGERVPFARLPPSPAPAAAETSRDVPLYPLPPRRGGELQAPVELRVSAGGAISVLRGSGRAPSPATPGWVFDLGDDAAARAEARHVELRWADTEFSAGYRLETSADLQRWALAGHGQLLQLGGTGAPLRHERVALPSTPPRFVRLVWDTPAAPPPLLGARLVRAAAAVPRDDALQRVALEPVAPARAEDALDGRALLFDLGGAVPLARVDLDLGPGTRVVPATVQTRARDDGGWFEHGRHAFWRLERDDRIGRSEPVAVTGTARWVRIVVDARAPRPDPQKTKLVVEIAPARLLLTLQGEPPFTLLAGDPRAEPAMLPIGTLVPDLLRERERFGRAALQPWRERPEAAERARAEARAARWRPWLLWAVLAAGVAALGAMAWRLARTKT